MRLRPGGSGGVCVSVCLSVCVGGAGEGVVCLSKNNEMCRRRGGGLGIEEGTRSEKPEGTQLPKSAGFNGLPPPISCVQVSGSVRDRLTFQSTTLMLTAHDLFGSGSGAGCWWSGTEG